VAKTSAEELYQFFQDMGFTDIDKDPECQNILEFRNRFESCRIYDIGEPCPQEGY